MSLKNLITVILITLGSSITIFSQVKAVTYELLHHEKEKKIDVYLVILNGETKQDIIPHRIQFNSQVSLVVPKGTPLVVEKTYNPLQNNKDKNSNTPTEWNSFKPLFSPKAAKKSDFYCIQPNMHPTSFYNDLKEGDKVKLMTLSTGKKKCGKVRLYDSDIDPKSNAEGMMGRNFSNSFCLGGVAQLFRKK
jgi:hypothetical protein